MTQLTFSEDHRHILLAAFPGWGHAKPMCVLASRIARARPTTVTVLAPATMFERMEKEIARQFGDHETEYHARVRLIAIPTNPQNMMDFELLNTSFAKAYLDLVEERPLTCVKSEKEHILPKPDAVIVDMFGNVMMHHVRKFSQTPVKVYGWVSCGATSMSRFWGPSSGNKERNLQELVEAEAERTGRPVVEVTAELLFPNKGSVIDAPGVPPMYDYEHFPQAVALPHTIVVPFHMSAVDVLNNADGVLMAAPRSFESQAAMEHIVQWFEEGSKEIHLVGPMLSPRKATVAASDKAADFDEFMAHIFKSHGPHSMLYISFGSVFWPSNPQTVYTFLDALLERNVPFIFSHGSPFAQVSEEVKAKVAASDIGLLSPWSPQEAILAHPVTGWFVSHCGYNSTMESVNAGVPIICWPYAADQPLNAAHLTQVLDVAYELTEVRSGLHAKKPIYRIGKAPEGTPESVKTEINHILDLAFGEDGQQKRANMAKLRDAVAHAWAEEGASSLALSQFLDSF